MWVGDVWRERERENEKNPPSFKTLRAADRAVSKRRRRTEIGLLSLDLLIKLPCSFAQSRKKQG